MSKRRYKKKNGGAVFSDELILTIASRKVGFIVNRHNPNDNNKNKRAYQLEGNGYLVFDAYDSVYLITPKGRERLEEIKANE